MTRLDDFAAPEPAPNRPGLTLAERLRLRWAGLTLGTKPLWSEIRAFAEWLESQCFPAARSSGLERLLMEVRPDGGVHAFGFRLPDQPREFRRLSGFLAGVCIRQLQLDPRLESNQIADVLTLLYAHRGVLPRRDESSADQGGLTDLWGQAGLQFACARTQIIADRLAVLYSYRTTRFGRLVRLFERRYGHFQDHRALFHAAGRYAAAAALVAVALTVAHAIYDSRWVLAGATVFAAAALFAMVYFFFMAIGSVEYDNEERARRLVEAYDQLKYHADRVHADLERARGVQEKILPELSNMPLAGCVDWASSFAPAAEVGGDYFDVIALDGRRAAILFADVSGHGMAAAFITAILKTSFQAWAEAGESLGEFLSTVNRNLCRLTPDDSFAAMFAAIYDADRGELSYVNCGHNPEPWLIPAAGDEPVARLENGRAMLLGITEDIVFRQTVQPLRRGDAVLLATDGLVEARSLYDRMYGSEGLEDFLAAHRGRPVGELVSLVTMEVTDFARGAEQADDRTVLAFQIK